LSPSERKEEKEEEEEEEEVRCSALLRAPTQKGRSLSAEAENPFHSSDWGGGDTETRRDTDIRQILRGCIRKRTIPTDRTPLVGEVSATVADRVCCVVSATAVNLGFLDPEPLLFHSSSSVIDTQTYR
jgi:hypothetical protein